MSIRAYNPDSCFHPETMKVGEVYVLPCAYWGHSAFTKLPNGQVVDHNGKPTQNRDFLLLDSPASLIKKLEDDAKHATVLAEFLKKRK